MSMAVNVQELLFNQDKEWQKSDSYILYFPSSFFWFFLKKNQRKLWSSKWKFTKNDT